MNKFINIFCTFLLIGCTDPELGLNHRIQNDLNTPLELRLYFPNFTIDQELDSVLIVLNPGGRYELYYSERGESDSYPSYFHEFLPLGDSLRIYFNDTIFVTHIGQRLNQDSLSGLALIYYDQDRNIYNPGSYVQRRLRENFFEGTYYITQEDFENALDFYE